MFFYYTRIFREIECVSYILITALSSSETLAYFYQMT